MVGSAMADAGARSGGRRRVLIALAIWLAVVGAGMTAVLRYSFAAGMDADAPRRWPSDSAVVRDDTRPTLLMIAHPRCPCTRASIGELAVLMARYKDRVSAHVLFVRPAGTGADFARS